MTLEQKLRDRLKEKLDAAHEREGEMLLGGNLKDLNEIMRCYGKRRAIQDAIELLDETYEDIMKE